MMGTHQNRRHRLNEDDKDDDLCAREISQTTHDYYIVSLKIIIGLSC